MSKLIYNGQLQTLALIGKYGYPIGTWPADTAAPHHLPDGEYKVQDQTAPFKPEGVELSPASECGSFGVIRVAVNGQEGAGVHSGGGGGVRTSDQAMEAIARTMCNDPLASLRVVRNEE
jgi:hypothetical protein